MLQKVPNSTASLFAPYRTPFFSSPLDSTSISMTKGEEPCVGRHISRFLRLFPEMHPTRCLSLILFLAFSCFTLSSFRIAQVDTVSRQQYLSSSFAAPTRLGNHMFELTSLLGISRTLNRVPIFWIEDEKYRRMLEQTREILPGLVEKYTVIEGKIDSGVETRKFPLKARVFDNPSKFEDVTDEYLHLSGHFYQSWKYFPNSRDEILGYLTREKKQFRGLPVSNETHFITCVHTRRGDFKSVGFYQSDGDFVEKAVEFMERRHRNKTHLKLKVVIFGDDSGFKKSIFLRTSDGRPEDVTPTTKYFVSRNSPVEDLLYSSQHCDSVLISAPGSTFGWWIGYLSKGNDVFYLDVRTVDDRVFKEGRMKLDDYYPPKWTMLKKTSEGDVVETSL